MTGAVLRATAMARSSAVVRAGAVRVPRAAALLGGIATAALLRAAINGHDATSAFIAGGLFGAALIALAWVGGWRPMSRSARGAGRAGRAGRAAAIGLAGGLVLVALPAVARSGPAVPIGMGPEPWPIWAAITVLVAAGEEVVLRGVLFDAVGSGFGSRFGPRFGSIVAVAITSLAFALLHVPLYGWAVVPLDLAVGIWLAGLRLATGGAAAPAVAHAIADLATWWL
jgi:membrane protease YdiL (CAAX protease family)